MSDPKPELSGLIKQIVDDAFDQGAAIALRTTRDALIAACNVKIPGKTTNTLDAHEIRTIMDGMIEFTVKGKK